MKETLDRIKLYIEDGEMSFLIGAGFSRNVNKEAYPMWGGLLMDAVWKMFGSGKRTEQTEKDVLAKVEKEYGYLGFASLLVRKAGYHEAIDTYIESKTPYIKTVGGKQVLLLNGKLLHKTINPNCHLLLKNLDIQNIYTFNYDNALEFFLGEEAKLALEDKIRNTVRKIEELENLTNDLKQQESSLNEKLAKAPSEENNMPKVEVVENSDEEITETQKLEQKLQDIHTKLSLNLVELNERKSSLDADKRDLKTYYNVVKDSYEISLSAKRKSIYKIHGSLREKADADYGFDGDTHTQYIITQEDYDSYNEKHGAFVSMMRIDLLRSRFCIMGVSGGDANFLAWINWVKDVLDKTKDRAKQGNENQHQSYFIYSGSNDMPEELALMLKNHFIEPVILKDVFPGSKNDEERIKLFLEYLQPFSNKEAAVFSKLWGSVSIPRDIKSNANPISDKDASELFRLSEFNKFNAPYSTAHYTATDVQFSSQYYLKEGAPVSERKVYAAALRTSLMPIDLSCSTADLTQMDKESDKSIRMVYENVCRRSVLLQHLSGKSKQMANQEKYTRLLYNLYDYKFPTEEEVEELRGNTGLDFVRWYSILRLLRVDISSAENQEPGVFNSPQELVLAADWLKYIGYKNLALFKKGDEYKHQGRLLSLYDYCNGYLTAMRRKEELNTYGNFSETVYLDKYTLDVTNGAVLLNSFVELGICFSGQTLMDDTDWIEIVKALRQRYPVALAFYTIVRNGKEKAIKFVAQELMYDENSRKKLPTVLKNIISSLVSDQTPVYLKGKMAQFASEILPAVNQKRWSQLFITNAEAILDEADKYNKNLDLSKSIYGFVAKALEHISAKELRLGLLKRVFEKMDMDDRYGSYYNTLAISAREHLKPSDFAPLNSLFIAFAKKTADSNNQQANFILMNLMMLMEGENKRKVLKLMEYHSVRDAFLIGGYVFHIKDYPDLVKSFIDYYLKGEDLWSTGITNKGVHIGGGNISVSQIDKLLSFNDEQVDYVYNDLKTLLGKINMVFQRKNRPKEDKGWMSPENNFREVLMDMRLFVNRHPKQLAHHNDFESTYNCLVKTYEQSFFGKDIFGLIADDEMYRAIRRVMNEVELFGIDNYRTEYEQFIGRIISKDSNELNSLFRHVSWAMNHYTSFFNDEKFKKLFKAVLNVYQPYFDTANGDPQVWNLIGCQKEEAEKALVSISKTMNRWGEKDNFWSQHKRVFY